jgi:hypothetical protein
LARSKGRNNKKRKRIEDKSKELRKLRRGKD